MHRVFSDPIYVLRHINKYAQMCPRTQAKSIFTNRIFRFIPPFVENVETDFIFTESIDTAGSKCYNKVKATDNGVGIPDRPLSVFRLKRGEKMAVTLAMLCGSTEEKYSMKLVAGRAGMDNIVRWVHIVEDSGAKPFLRGGELAVTTGIGHTDTAWLAGFVEALRNGGAAGAVILVGAAIPAVPDDVVRYCEHNSFPLFTITDSTKILDMTYELCRRITGMEKHDSALNDALRAVISDPSSLRSHTKLLTRSELSDESGYSAVAACLISETGEAVSADPLSENAEVRRTVKNMKHRSTVLTHKGILAAVCQNSAESEIKALCECLKSAADPKCRIFIGVSDSVRGLAGISTAYEQAEAAMVSSVLSGMNCSLYRNIGILQLILGVKDKSILRSYVREQLGKLHDHDSEHGTDLTHILRVYLENNCSVNEAAAIEKVHRNTVNSKVRAVKELLGHELDDVTKSRLVIAFLINDVLRVYDEKLNTLK